MVVEIVRSALRLSAVTPAALSPRLMHEGGTRFAPSVRRTGSKPECPWPLLEAAKIATGEQVWAAAPPNPRLCASTPRCNASQGGATTGIPGAVLAGSHDGGLRAYSTADGSVLWQFDTNKEFPTVNGVKATGASIDGSPLIVSGGMIFVNSGYGGIAARPGNVFLAFGLD